VNSRNQNQCPLFLTTSILIAFCHLFSGPATEHLCTNVRTRDIASRYLLNAWSERQSLQNAWSERECLIRKTIPAEYLITKNPCRMPDQKESLQNAWSERIPAECLIRKRVPAECLIRKTIPAECLIRKNPCRMPDQEESPCRMPDQKESLQNAWSGRESLQEPRVGEPAWSLPPFICFVASLDAVEFRFISGWSDSGKRTEPQNLPSLHTSEYLSASSRGVLWGLQTNQTRVWQFYVTVRTF
jgi:hypothetical protein